MPAESFPNNNFHEIALAFKNNEEHVLKKLYQEHYKMVEQYILQNSGDKDDAKDIYQEAFVAVWRNIQLDKFVPQHSNSLGAYIFQVSKNKWISHLRSVKNKNSVALDTGTETIAEETSEEAVNDIEKVAGYFKQLGEQCKEVLSRFYYNKESMKAIAARFNWTEATAKNNKYRCLEKLRSLLKNQP